MALVLVSATRATPQAFGATLLGQSLRRLQSEPRVRARIAFENRAGLPLVYNAGLASCQDEDQVAFVHDDVLLDDYHLVDRLSEALQSFDVVGVAGNRRRLPGQPSWGFVDMQGTWDAPEWLSGAVGDGSTGTVSRFGPVPAACELLDGLLLVARVGTLRAAGLAFDPRFAFHFYDLDFCRSARAAGLRLGTWPLALTHASPGNFNAAWRAAAPAYFDKWGD